MSLMCDPYPYKTKFNTWVWAKRDLVMTNYLSNDTSEVVIDRATDGHVIRNAVYDFLQGGRSWEEPACREYETEEAALADLKQAEIAHLASQL